MNIGWHNVYNAHTHAHTLIVIHCSQTYRLCYGWWPLGDTMYLRHIHTLAHLHAVCMHILWRTFTATIVLSLKEDALRHANSSVPSSQMSEDDPGMVKPKKYLKTTQCMQIEKDLTKPRADTHTHCVWRHASTLWQGLSVQRYNRNIQYTCQMNLHDPQFSLSTIKN